MYFHVIISALILTSTAASALIDSLNSSPERSVRSRSDYSRITRRCPAPTEEDPDPPCHPIHPPPPVQDPSVHGYTINDPTVNKIPVNFKITVPGTLSVATWADTLHANLKTTLPDILKQLYVDPNQIPALAEEGLPYLVEAITTLQSDLSLPDTSSDLARRGLFSKIGRWIKKVVTAIVKAVEEIAEDIGCTIFANLALPGFMFSDIGFTVLNTLAQGVSTTPDQDYFISPEHGSVSHDDSIQIYYDATFAPGFSGASATTFGKNIYMRANQDSNTGTTPLAQSSAFQATTKTLLHEFTHVKQYKAVGYVDSVFGIRYLYDYCKARFDYNGDALEKEAFIKQEEVNGLLQDVIGTQFFDLWKRNNWAGPFGSPTSTTYMGYQSLPSQYYLPFQNGGLTLTCDPRTNVC